MLLTGTFRRSLDEKLRFAIPRSLRIALGNSEPLTLVVAPGTDGCLSLFTEESFRQLGERLAAGSPTAQQVRAFSRLFYARAQRVELDGQGRMRLPADLHELAALDREVMVIGVRDHLELWSVSRWEAYIAEKSGHYDHLAEEAFDKE